MRTRRIRLFAVSLVLAGTLAACGDSSSSAPASSSPPASAGAPASAGLPARALAAGEVEVKITPTRLDDKGATFAIVLDTHSADLSVDLTTAAVLDVGGTAWAVEGWTGDPPGGHHREGELSFTAKGPATGTASLTIAGLPEPVETTWDLGGD
jgi:hypothetical protein